MATAAFVPAPNTAAMAAFLGSAIGEAIHLVAIVPDTADVRGQWFGANAGDAASWATIQNRRGANVYWTVNVTRTGFTGKPKKTDIAGARFLHVDIDPPKDGGDFERAAVMVRLDGLRHPPSFVLDSGNGVQAFWRLDEPAQNLPAVEGYNRRLSQMLGGDHCHNIDRLMRLPGSVNYPDARKAARGRIPAMAGVLSDDTGEAVEAEAMHAILPELAETDRAEQAERAAVDLGGLELTTLDALGIRDNDVLAQVVRNGDPSHRSEVAMKAAGMLVRRQRFTDRQIAGLLLNPEYRVSDHLLDQPNPVRSVRRVIGRARADQQSGQSVERPSAPPPQGEAPRVVATPYLWCDPATIPPRRWVYGRSIQRGHLRAVVAQGAAGKTILSVAEALAMVTGRNLLGQEVPGGPKRVWLWNLEDDREELSRIIQAACKHWNIGAADLDGRLFVDSALDGAILKLATSTPAAGLVINRPLVAALTDEMKGRGIDYLHVDPFVSSHAANESDNMEIDAIAKEWALVAKNADAAVGVAHHVSKAGAAEATALSARGAVALVNACRSVLTLNRMSEDEAKRWGIEDERRRRFFRVYDDKNNRAPPSDKSDWYTMASVSLGNDVRDYGDHSDSMGVVIPWSPPDAFEGITLDHLRRVQQVVAAGEYKAHHTATDWVGNAVADALGWDAQDKGDRARILKLVSTWEANGVLRVEERKDQNRQLKKFMVVGKAADDTSATPAASVASQGVAVSQPSATLHPAPRRGAGVAAAARGGKTGHGDVAGNPALGPVDRTPRDFSRYERRAPILAPGETGDEPIPDGFDNNL